MFHPRVRVLRHAAHMHALQCAPLVEQNLVPVPGMEDLMCKEVTTRVIQGIAEQAKARKRPRKQERGGAVVTKGHSKKSRRDSSRTRPSELEGDGQYRMTRLQALNHLKKQKKLDARVLPIVQELLLHPRHASRDSPVVLEPGESAAIWLHVDTHDVPLLSLVVGDASPGGAIPHGGSKKEKYMAQKTEFLCLHCCQKQHGYTKKGGLVSGTPLQTTWSCSCMPGASRMAEPVMSVSGKYDSGVSMVNPFLTKASKSDDAAAIKQHIIAPHAQVAQAFLTALAPGQVAAALASPPASRLLHSAFSGTTVVHTNCVNASCPRHLDGKEVGVHGCLVQLGWPKSGGSTVFFPSGDTDGHEDPILTVQHSHGMLHDTCSCCLLTHPLTTLWRRYLDHRTLW